MPNLLGETEARASVSSDIKTLNRRLHTGEYEQRWVSCFCGSENGKILANQDRYGVFYRPTLCMDCGLIYANPQMTDETLSKFYKDDYRKIFDYGVAEEDNHNRLKNCGTALLEILQKHWDCTPKRVLEIGCHTGEMLDAFYEAGADCTGIEIDEPCPNGKFDLIILHHVLEHFTNPARELGRIRDILADDGRVYIGVPGMFSRQWNPITIWQCAHTYQFCSDTLQYVMECCGFEEQYCSESIVSVWGKSQRFREKANRPEGIAERIDLLLQGKPYPAPRVRTYNKFPVKERKERIALALSKGAPDICTLQGASNGRAVIIGGGPSVAQEVAKIRQLILEGAEVFAIERMLHWCLSQDIVPKYVVCVDGSEDCVESLTDAPDNVTYLLAAQVVPEVWDLLEGKEVVLFHGPQPDIDLPALWEEYGYDEVRMINTAGSVTLSTMTVAMTLGARVLDIFGFDCHITQGRYAAGIRGVGVNYSEVPITVGQRDMVTTPAYLSFVQDFFSLETIARNKGLVDSITVHGDSLVTAMRGGG